MLTLTAPGSTYGSSGLLGGLAAVLSRSTARFFSVLRWFVGFGAIGESLGLATYLPAQALKRCRSADVSDVGPIVGRAIVSHKHRLVVRRGGMVGGQSSCYFSPIAQGSGCGGVHRISNVGALVTSAPVSCSLRFGLLLMLGAINCIGHSIAPVFAPILAYGIALDGVGLVVIGGDLYPLVGELAQIEMMQVDGVHEWLLKDVGDIEQFGGGDGCDGTGDKYKQDGENKADGWHGGLVGGLLTSPPIELVLALNGDDATQGDGAHSAVLIPSNHRASAAHALHLLLFAADQGYLVIFAVVDCEGEGGGAVNHLDGDAVKLKVLLFGVDDLVSHCRYLLFFVIPAALRLMYR